MYMSSILNANILLISKTYKKSRQFMLKILFSMKNYC